MLLTLQVEFKRIVLQISMLMNMFYNGITHHQFELRVASSANPNQRALLGRTSIRNRSFEAPFNSAFIRPGQYSILTITPFIVFNNTASPIAGPSSQTIVNRP